MPSISGFVRLPINALWGALGLNGFVYNSCLRQMIRRPDNPVRPVELYGQLGEDLIVTALIEARGIGDDLTRKSYLEIGGNHPFATSATFLLSKKLGMRGVIVEANPDLIPDLKKGRPNDIILHGAVQDQDIRTVKLFISKLSEISSLDQAFMLRLAQRSNALARVAEVPALRVNQIVRDYLNNEAPCFLSIDVEGLDLQILKDFDFERYRPWLVQIEYLDNRQQASSNANEIIEYMHSVEYRLVAKTAVNLIFADR